MYAKIIMPTEIDGVNQEFTVENATAFTKMIESIAKRNTRAYDYAVSNIEEADGVIIATFGKRYKVKS